MGRDKIRDTDILHYYVSLRDGSIESNSIISRHEFSHERPMTNNPKLRVEMVDHRHTGTHIMDYRYTKSKRLDTLILLLSWIQ